MPDNKNQWVEKRNNSEAPKKRSFFWWSLDANSKDFLDFRYNTQEEIDKLNGEMTTAGDLDEIMKQAKNINNEKSLNKNDDNEYHSEEDLNQDSEEPIEWEIIENADEDKDVDSFNNENKDVDENIERNDIDEWNIEVINNWNEAINQSNSTEENNHKDEGDESPENKLQDNDSDEEVEKYSKENTESSEIIKDSVDDMNDEIEDNESWDGARFFDPFELNFEEEWYESWEDDENFEWNNGIFDPFGLNEEEDSSDNDTDSSIEDTDISNDDIDSPLDEGNVSDDDIDSSLDENDVSDDDDDSSLDENDVSDDDIDSPLNEGDVSDDDIDSSVDEDVISDDDIDSSVDEGDISDDDIDSSVDEDVISDDDIDSSDNEKSEEKFIHKDSSIWYIKNNQHDDEEGDSENSAKKSKKHSKKWEKVSDEEIQLEQWQDMPNLENDEEYNPSDEEIFEQEPDFFADDEMSQQFFHLVKNVRWIFKLEHKDGEHNPYFKILWWKTPNSTLEYLFYLIEEEDEPIDLYIKKVEVDQWNWEENEHLVQFSYNKDQELNVFVDEVILYEWINKWNSDSKEWIDTKSVIEKFIFLTQTYYDKLEQQQKKEQEERQKKRQLQQIFKGF